MDDPAGSLPEDLRRFVSEVKWTYAKTMPRWPHEYIVRERGGRGAVRAPGPPHPVERL